MENFKAAKIFIVDDDPMYQEICKQYLDNIGFKNITLFDNGQDCVNRLTEEPDVIFLDHEMYPIDGMEVLKKIKRFNPDIYLVVLSAQENMQVAVNVLKYGAFDYIIKGNDENKRIADVMNKIEQISELLKQKNTSRLSKLLSFLTL